MKKKYLQHQIFKALLWEIIKNFGTKTGTVDLRASVHFDRFALFQLFCLDGNLFATFKFSNKNFFEHKLPLLSLLC